MADRNRSFALGATLALTIQLAAALAPRAGLAASDSAGAPLSLHAADLVISNYRFASGETLPELRVHYTTLGQAHRDARGRVDNAVLILHATGGSGRSFLVDRFARVLFGKGVNQITAGEGLQLAAAAASLAGGGPGVLDRLRGGLGLDWFRLGSSTTGLTTGTLNPGGASMSATSGTALSAGKYIAPGVSVGVSQGISPPTSKVTVEVEVRPHLTVGGEAGQSGSTGVGINYNYDY